MGQKYQSAPECPTPLHAPCAVSSTLFQQIHQINMEFLHGISVKAPILVGLHVVNFPLVIMSY